MFKADMMRRIHSDAAFARFELSGVEFTARAVYDPDAGAPDERQDGFWPSLDPSSPGYIGPRSATTLRRRMARAREIMRLWRAERWWWVGVVVHARNDEGLSFASDALWGIECNYPTFRKDRPYDNTYLLETANELLPGVMEKAGVPLLVRKSWEANHG